MAFLTTLDEFDYKPLNNGLVENQGKLVWQDPVTHAVYTVPDGFPSNLMSYPWWSGWLFNKLDNTGRASMLHDYLVDKTIGNSMWRDDQYRAALKADGVNKFKRGIAYTGLRIVSGPSGIKIR